MRPDVLFWFYDEFAVCETRARRLRHDASGARIYALYGGPTARAAEASAAVSKWVDDFYTYPEERSSKWKWRHGDQLLASWYHDRGQHLPWDSLFIMQWDMALFAPPGELFRDLDEGEALFSGFRPMSEVQAWWPWARDEGGDVAAFRDWLSSQFGYRGPLHACLFIVSCLPRELLHGFVAAGRPVTGFLEYKFPTLAAAIGIPVCQRHTFDPWWGSDPTTRGAPARRRILNAVGQEVSTAVIDAELARDRGARLFHPRSRLHPREMGDIAPPAPDLEQEA